MALKLMIMGRRSISKWCNCAKISCANRWALTFDKEELEKEMGDILIGAFEDERMLGCCMLIETEPGTVRLRQMAVSNNLQGKGIGRALMQFAENIARDRGFRKITMHARKSATGFYEKLGYFISGGEFEEVTLPHVVMEKRLIG